MTKEELIHEAFEAMKNSYAPYSNYHVGACIEATDGRRFWGVNVENASYGATICAERSAGFAAYSKSCRTDTIKALAIVSDGPRIAAPCGICRQVLCELLNEDTPIYLSNGKEETVTCMKDLLPMQFQESDVHHS